MITIINFYKGNFISWDFFNILDVLFFYYIRYKKIGGMNVLLLWIQQLEFIK